MVINTTIYFDDKEMSPKEALWAATAAVKHQPQERGAHDHDLKLPNGKELVVQCNSANTQIRVAKVPQN